MKRIALIATICLSMISASASLSAQEAPKGEKKSTEQRQQEFQEMRMRLVAYYTAEIGLTSEEAEAFWPIFDNLQKGRWKINHERRKLLRPRKEGEAPIDHERFNKLLMKLKQDEYNLAEDTHKELEKILSPEKVYKFYQAEEKFTRSMMKRMEKK